MATHSFKKGLALPITGDPAAGIVDGPTIESVAILGHDYPTMKPRMLVAAGDRVKRGQALFEDRKSEGVVFTAPGAGTIRAIHRGEKRKFLSIVIDLSDAEKTGDVSAADKVSFSAYTGAGADSMSGDDVRALMAESGLWTAIRQRPFDRVPSPSAECAAVFVTATNSNPLAGSMVDICAGKEDLLLTGLTAINKITSGTTYFCVDASWKTDVSKSGVQTEVFTGPHPSGLVGTHIHTLCSAHRERTVFHLGVQDVIALGHLIQTGELMVDRVVTLAGPAVTEGKMMRSRIGASTAEFTKGRLREDAGELRVVSGSVFHGTTAAGEGLCFLGRYDQQVTVLAEDRERVFFGWLMPGFDKFSTIRSHLSGFLPKRKRAFTTTSHGGHRAMVPIGMFERVMPLDIMPTFLLRALVVGDVENAEALGALELGEEDLALCNFVAPGKEDFGKALRSVLDDIWKEG